MTNIVEFEGRPFVERQAREWLIRLDGDAPLSCAEGDSLREWMARSALHRAELTRLAKFWNQANVLTELVVPPGPEANKHRGHHWVGAAAAAGVVLVFALTWWGLMRSDGVANGTYGTAIGQQQTLSLPDGSSIQLNTDTQVQVCFSDSLRRIRLLRGEALFSVTSDPRRVFEVYAVDGVVRAVGTAFAVRIEGNTVDLTVTKGVVDVAEISKLERLDSEPSARPKLREVGRLKAGQITSFGAAADHLHVRQLAEPELQRRMAWHEGYLVFSGEPLSEVVEQMNRYSPMTLEIGDPRLRAIAIGGRFRIGDLDAILDALHSNFGIRSRQVDERNILLESESRAARPL